MRLLYESLTDFSEGRSLLAIFKLATSVEILCDRTFERYLEMKGIPKELRGALVRSGRSWNARFDRAARIMPEHIELSEIREFRDSKKVFDETVRQFRDSFAHNDQATATYQDAKRSFNSSVPIFWALDRLQEAMTKKSTELR